MPAMRLNFIALFLLPLLVSQQAGNKSPIAQTPSQTPAVHAQSEETPDDLRADLEEGIKHVLISQVEAWNHGKLEGFMQGYWHSPDLTFFSGGAVTKGWESTLLRYRQR